MMQTKLARRTAGTRHSLPNAPGQENLLYTNFDLRGLKPTLTVMLAFT